MIRPINFYISFESLSLHFCCTSLGFRNREASWLVSHCNLRCKSHQSKVLFVVLWALEVSLFMNVMRCEFCDTKNE